MILEERVKVLGDEILELNPSPFKFVSFLWVYGNGSTFSNLVLRTQFEHFTMSGIPYVHAQVVGHVGCPFLPFHSKKISKMGVIGPMDLP